MNNGPLTCLHLLSAEHLLLQQVRRAIEANDRSQPFTLGLTDNSLNFVYQHRHEFYTMFGVYKQFYRLVLNSYLLLLYVFPNTGYNGA